MWEMIIWWMESALLVYPPRKNLWLLPYEPNTGFDVTGILATAVSLAQGEWQDLRSLRKTTFMWNANNNTLFSVRSTNIN